jgi:hypothetical protein
MIFGLLKIGNFIQMVFNLKILQNKMVKMKFIIEII